MGIITISRISTEIIGVFALDRDIDPQLDFFSDVRFFPDKIHVCLNKIDLIENFGEKELENVKKKITDFFEKRRVKVEDFFITCGEIIEGFEDVESYNNKVPEMILSIVSQKTWIVFGLFLSSTKIFCVVCYDDARQQYPDEYPWWVP